MAGCSATSLNGNGCCGDFKKRVGLPAEAVDNTLQTARNTLERGERPTLSPALFAKLQAYWQHQYTLLQSFEKDPDQREAMVGRSRLGLPISSSCWTCFDPTRAECSPADPQSGQIVSPKSPSSGQRAQQVPIGHAPSFLPPGPGAACRLHAAGILKPNPMGLPLLGVGKGGGLGCLVKREISAPTWAASAPPPGCPG